MPSDATVIVFGSEDESDGEGMCKDGFCEIDWGEETENECTNSKNI